MSQLIDNGIDLGEWERGIQRFFFNLKKLNFKERNFLKKMV